MAVDKVFVEKKAEKPIATRVPQSVWNRLDNQVIRLNVSKTAIVRMAIIEWLEKQESIEGKLVRRETI